MQNNNKSIYFRTYVLKFDKNAPRILSDFKPSRNQYEISIRCEMLISLQEKCPFHPTYSRKLCQFEIVYQKITERLIMMFLCRCSFIPKIGFVQHFRLRKRNHISTYKEILKMYNITSIHFSRMPKEKQKLLQKNCILLMLFISFLFVLELIIL